MVWPPLEPTHPPRPPALGSSGDTKSLARRDNRTHREPENDRSRDRGILGYDFNQRVIGIF